MIDLPPGLQTAHDAPDGTALVSADTQDSVRWLRLNRPSSANALDEPIQRALSRALRDAADDPSVAAVVLASASERIFCAGADLKEYRELAPDVARRRRRDRLGQTLIQLASFSKPIVACVTGKAIGAGCMLAFLCDEIVAGEQAFFSLPEIRLGMVSPVAAAIARHRGGRAAVQTLVMRGDVLDGVAARATGLVEDLVPGDVSAVAQALAQTRAMALGALNADAYGRTKLWAHAAVRAEIREGLEEADRLDMQGLPSTAR